MGKRYKKMMEGLDLEKVYSPAEAIEMLQKCPPVKFDQTVDVALKLGVDPRKADQLVRSTVSLPHGTGQTAVVVVLCKGDKVQEALDAGADFAGSDELIEKIKGGWTDFTALITTPDMMRDVGKLGKILGPRNLMPTPKAGTVTPNVADAVKEVKAGKIEFKTVTSGMINNVIGKISFSKEKLVENLEAFLAAIYRAKPSGAKGQYMQKLYLSSTMGPGVQIDPAHFPTA